MMKTESIPYQTMGNLGRQFVKSRGKKILDTFFTGYSAVLFPMAFLLGRASMTGGLMPFGTAIFAAAFGINISRIMLAAVVLVGMLTGGAQQQLYLSVFSMLLISIFSLAVKPDKSRMGFKLSLIAFLSVIVSEFTFVFLQGILLYDVLNALLHAFIVFLLVFIFRKAVTVASGFGRRHVLTNEEMISAAVTAALALSGLSGFLIFGFSVKNAACILLILIFSYKSGSGSGAAIGVTVGLIVSMSSNVTPLVIGSYAFCGLLAGVLKSLGKLGSSLGFVMGNAVLTLYLNGSTDVLIHLKEIIAAMIIFLILPQNAINILVGAFARTSEVYLDKRSYSERIKDLTVEKLNKFSRAFTELSKTFSELSQTKVVADKQDLASMFDRVVERVCKDCSLCMHCWDRNFCNTYQVMFKIIERIDSKGRIDENDIPQYFLDRCERVNDFVEALNNVYEIFKVDMVWKNKIGESRELVSQQLSGLSKVVSNLASEIDMEIQFKGNIEDAVTEDLGKAGVKVADVVVFENKWGKYEVNIYHKGCGGKRSCITTIEKIVSSTIGRKMAKDSRECTRNERSGVCVIKLVEDEAFKVTTGVARAAKHGNTVSGDNYTFLNSEEGKYVIALSDGMGSGQKASIQSKATISLLEQFIESGFDKDTAIRLINSILVLKSSDDSFSTIDLSVIDLHDGEVEFVKIGAVPTFIKRSERVEVIRSVSLPVGILSNIEMELIHKRVGNGDIVIMMSDGIADAFKGDDDKDRNLVDFIQNITSMNPQKIADDILKKACELCEGRTIDDMLVLAAKVWMRA